jgi:DNA-binding CsgD family transcriptional regulator
LGEPRAVARGLCNLSEVLIRTNRLDAAEISIAEATAIAAGLPDKRLLGNLLCNRGDLAAQRGDWPLARQRYRAALRRYGDAGHTHDIVLALVGLGRALLRLGHVGEAMMQLHRAEVMAERTGNARPLAYARKALADAAASTNRLAIVGVTPRQAEVLGYLAAGLSNRDIARTLHLSVTTVERHLATVYRNVGLRGRVAAARFAAENGLLSTFDQ